MNRYVGVAAVLGALAVAAGAMGAHALEGAVTAERLAVWETAAEYHLFHAIVILVLALQPEGQDSPQWRLSLLGFTVGIVLFSFSLYALVLSGITQFAMVTPFGGLVLIASWLSLLRRSAA